MSARTWCAALLVLGAADLAAINLWVGPRLVADEPLTAAIEEIAARRPLTAAAGRAPIDDGAAAPQPAAAAAPTLPQPAAAPVVAVAEPIDEPAAEPVVEAPAAEPPAAEPAAAEPAPSAAIAAAETPPAAADRELAPPVDDRPTVQARSAPLDDSGELPVTIYFATDRATLWPAAQQRLDEVATSLAAHPDWSLRISGHADARGTDDHNTHLSERRVRRVREYLASRGVTPDRVVGRAFGERQPVAPDSDAVALHRNRRVEIQFTRSLP